jgi:hypothetical protein
MGTVESPLPLPSPDTVQQALRATTERLAAEVADPKHSAPDWSDFEWRIARAVAAMHGVSGLLSGSLLWRGPSGWVDFLAGQREHIARQQQRIRALLAAVGGRFESLAVPAQALKGAALHSESMYQPGERPMADLDLLVPGQHAARAAAVLEDLGLRESQRTVKHRVFVARHATPQAPFGESGDNDMKVELHERICEPLPLRLTDIAHLVSSPNMLPGLNPYPSRAALMAHLLLHAGGGMAYRTVRMIQLHDIALLAKRLTQQDWQQLLIWEPWWAWPPLALAERYYGPLGSPGIAATLRAHCPPILRHACARQCLSDVSLSRLWLEAFPGIEWARSTGEAISYIGRRIVPSAEELAARREGLKSEPSLAQGDWGRLSQGRRILRALSSRTPRPWPLYNVRAALAERH